MYAVQGPKAMDIVKSLATEDISGLKRFQIVENHIGDVAVKIAKGGYTGENGYEIYCDVKDDSKIEERWSRPLLPLEQRRSTNLM